MKTYKQIEIQSIYDRFDNLIFSSKSTVVIKLTDKSINLSDPEFRPEY